jgi:hypothetical protein
MEELTSKEGVFVEENFWNVIREQFQRYNSKAP